MGFVVDKVPLGQVFVFEKFCFPPVNIIRHLHIALNRKTRWGYFPKSSDLSEIGEYWIEMYFQFSLGLVFEGLKSKVTHYPIRSFRHFGQENYVMVRWKLLSLKSENTK